MGTEDMTPNILDTNVIVRFLVGDHAAHHRQAEEWFRQGQQGRRNIIVSPIVIAETAFVLESYYKLDRKAIADHLEVFVSQRWLEVEDRSALQGLWNDYRQGLHFVDSFLLARAREDGATVLTFDKKLAR